MQNSEESQRASAITDAETSNVLLSTIQALIKGMNETSQAMKKAQQDNDESWLEDEEKDGAVNPRLSEHV